MAIFLIESGAKGRSPPAAYADSLLTLALKEELADVALKLIDAGADINHVEQDGYTPVMLASRLANAEVVSRLINAGADVNHVSWPGPRFTALLVSANSNKPLTTAHLIDAGADVNARGVENRTALIYAAQRGAKESVELLLKHGADVNAADDKGFTALFMSIDGQHTDVANLLIASGADINANNYKGATPYLYALEVGLADFAESLIDKGLNIAGMNGTIALVYSVQKKHYDLAKRLIDAGVELNAVWEDGRATPLIAAAATGDFTTVKRMVDAGADPAMTNLADESPHSVATKLGHTDIATYLHKVLQHAAKPNTGATTDTATDTSE